MFSSLRNRFGIPGVISVIALVFAMFGGAYAATDNGGEGNNANASAKAKKGPRGPKGPAGPAGPQGPAGPAGAVGPKGDTGPAGANGAPGAPGAKGATGATGATGVQGSPWTAGGTLPSGKTETGAWAFAEGTSSSSAYVPASFPIPLDANAAPNVTVHVAPDVVDPENPDPNCPGTVEDPKANPGRFCVYKGELVGAKFFETFFGPEPIGKPSSPFFAGVDVSGAVIKFQTTTANASGTGTWAVTAP